MKHEVNTDELEAMLVETTRAVKQKTMPLSSANSIAYLVREVTRIQNTKLRALEMAGREPNQDMIRKLCLDKN